MRPHLEEAVTAKAVALSQSMLGSSCNPICSGSKGAPQRQELETSLSNRETISLSKQEWRPLRMSTLVSTPERLGKDNLQPKYNLDCRATPVSTPNSSHEKGWWWFSLVVENLSGMQETLGLSPSTPKRKEGQ